MTIGQRVKKLRMEKGLTQTELAEKLGYKSKSSVAHIENGRDIPRSMVVALSDILDTTPAYLMGWEDPDDKKSALADDSESVKKLKEIMEKISQLSDSDFIQLDNFVRFLVAQSKGKTEE